MVYQEFEFPPVIKKAVKGLNNELRWKIIESIIKKGDLSYSNLMNELKLDNKGLLNFHLKELSKSALVERYEDLNKKSGDRSFYAVSEIGKEIINGLLAGLNPRKRTLYFDPDLLKTDASSGNYNTGEPEMPKAPKLEDPMQVAAYGYT